MAACVSWSPTRSLVIMCLVCFWQTGCYDILYACADIHGRDVCLRSSENPSTPTALASLQEVVSACSSAWSWATSSSLEFASSAWAGLAPPSWAQWFATAGSSLPSSSVSWLGNLQYDLVHSSSSWPVVEYCDNYYYGSKS
eukprot:724823-Amphidinium_carterae.1